MRRNRWTKLSSAALALAGLLAIAGCDVEVPDLNNPGTDQLEDTPTATKVAAACTGLLIGSRAGTSAANGFIMQMAILGREGFNFDPADPRFVSEMLEGSLSPASPFGGAFWGQGYTNMRLGDIIQRAKDNVPDFGDGADTKTTAISGFVKTIRALDLLRLLETRDNIGAVIDTDHDFDTLAPIVGKVELQNEIVRLLDEGADELAGGGDAFPFQLSSGFEGFDAPSTTFLQFNRALRVRIAIYQAELDPSQYDTVLELLPETFLNDAPATVADLEVGTYHAFGTGIGDVQNGLVNPNIWTHPSVVADAEDNDTRVFDPAQGPRVGAGRKVAQAAGTQSDRGVTATDRPLLYTRPDSRVPIIRNEELLLFRAEAEIETGDLAAAKADIDLNRSISGALPALADGLDELGMLKALIKERRYALLFEGRRLVDARRLNARMIELSPAEELADDGTWISAEIPLDTGSDPEGNPVPHQLNVRWPVNQSECNAGADATACGKGSIVGDWWADEQALLGN
ncbi:MAG TPA: RagB/SusD family nutrient uptake outer membrane protein [Kofleriaceae bacterium]|nr:RagB/SusD family nutrient uptake outer membrane protein [Kofleriaceae bacterium]